MFYLEIQSIFILVLRREKLEYFHGNGLRHLWAHYLQMELWQIYQLSFNKHCDESYLTLLDATEGLTQGGKFLFGDAAGGVVDLDGSLFLKTISHFILFL